MKGIKKMAERKPYTTKTRQIILEYLKSQKAVTVSVADIEKYLKTEGIKVNTTTVYRYLAKLYLIALDFDYSNLNIIINNDCFVFLSLNCSVYHASMDNSLFQEYHNFLMLFIQKALARSLSQKIIP